MRDDIKTDPAEHGVVSERLVDVSYSNKWFDLQHFRDYQHRVQNWTTLLLFQDQHHCDLIARFSFWTRQALPPHLLGQVVTVDNLKP